MEQLALSRKSLSLRLLLTFAVLGMAITYLLLALHIYIDTEFSISIIKEAYSTFDWIELTDHSHKYLPYYGIHIFAFALGILVLGTRYPEWLKVTAVIATNCLIVLDVGSMWAIRYIHAGIFSWVLYLAGLFLALGFAIIAALTLYDIWRGNSQ